MKKAILYSAISFVILYLLTAFIWSDIDFRMWYTGVRLMISAIWLVITVFLIADFLIVEYSNGFNFNTHNTRIDETKENSK